MLKTSIEIENETGLFLSCRSLLRLIYRPTCLYRVHTRTHQNHTIHTSDSECLSLTPLSPSTRPPSVTHAQIQTLTTNKHTRTLALARTHMHARIHTHRQTHTHTHTHTYTQTHTHAHTHRYITVPSSERPCQYLASSYSFSPRLLVLMD